MAIRVYIPETFIQLHLEVPHHPLLLQRIQKHPAGETEVILAEVAAYCGIAVDGTFDEEDLAKLADLCLTRLRGMKAKGEVYVPPENWEGMYEKVAREMEQKRRNTFKIH